MSKKSPFSSSIHQSIPYVPHVPFVSTLMEPSFTSVLSTFVDVVCVNHVSCSHSIDIGFTTPYSTISSGSVYSTSPISYHDEDVLDSLSTLDYPWDDPPHHSYFLTPQPIPFDQYVVELKYILGGHLFSISTDTLCYGDTCFQTHILILFDSYVNNILEIHLYLSKTTYMVHMYASII
jgi:hypothetical protein